LLAYCRKLTPSILLADQAVLDQMEPAELSRQIDYGRTVKVVVRLCGPESVEVIERLLMVGCVGFLSDHSSTATVRKAILAVAAGELWVSRRILSGLLQSLLHASRSNLTPREEEILHLIGLGCRNQEIATRLFISPETVRWHIRSLYSKIGVHDRLSALMYARSNRIIPPPSSLRTS
jgi:LuxR family transcriptional regulator of csgAB operon